LSEAIAYLKARTGGYAVVFPVHPRTGNRIAEWKLDLGPIIVCDPLGYFDMHRLVRSAVTVFTDSGGLQKEAYFHRVACVTMRNETEWVETVAAGWNRLWKGPDYLPRRDIAAYGDGHAAVKAVQIIVDYLRCPAKAESRPFS